ncbi:hypothetical protein HDV02_004873 [Globomyces sp. JEL0801]|nr:hypothetical protein HDV02_004873 [Globomyces sp. JEL0801]
MSVMIKPLQAKQAIPSNKKVSKPPPKRDFFKLRYFRTIDFYKSLGMNLDFDGEQFSFKPVVANPIQPANTRQAFGKTMESSHVKKTNLQEEHEDEMKGQGESSLRVLGLSYPSLAFGSNKDLHRVQLVFEEDLEFTQYTKEYQKQKDRDTKNDEATAPLKETTKENKQMIEKHDYEYLVIYVHFLPRLIKRMVAKGFELVLDIMAFDGVKMAIMKDPNNIQIRLIEMPDNNLNENGQKQWFARVAYFTVATSKADATVLMYESLFQIKNSKAQAKGKDKEAKNSTEPTELQAQISLRKTGAAMTAKNALTKGSGFRLVDMDDFVVGLTDSVFYWLGNDMRSSTCCLCFTEVSNADTGVAFTEHNSQLSPLVGIEAGTFARFSDKYNDLYLELICHKLDAAPTEKQKNNMRSSRAHINKPATHKEGDGPKDELEYQIDLNHLKGRTRTLSEGAIYCPKGFGYQLQKDYVPPVPPTDDPPEKKHQRKFGHMNNTRPIAGFHLADIPDTNHSHESLVESSNNHINNVHIPRPTFGYHDSPHDRAMHAAKKKKEKIKDKDEIVLELFISREKSRSA